MDSFNEASFKELENKMQEIADKFFYAKKKKEESEQYALFLNKVEKAYNTLSDLEKNLINNEFFYQSYSQWWRPLFSKATFYRYKKDTMQKFLEAFYGI